MAAVSLLFFPVSNAIILNNSPLVAAFVVWTPKVPTPVESVVIANVGFAPTMLAIFALKLLNVTLDEVLTLFP